MIVEITVDDYELAEAALAVTAGSGENYDLHRVRAMRMLRDECDWSLAKAKKVLDLILVGGRSS